MLTHADVWNALDTIATNNQISSSCLARFSGLNATTFNKSKRYDAVGKERYPSIGTLIKVLNGRGMSMTEFGNLCDYHAASREHDQQA